MRDKYEKSVTLRCVTCGDTELKYSEDKSTIVCQRCGREYPGGYDELVTLNQPEIDREVEKLEKEALKYADVELEKFMKEMNRKNR